MRWLPGIDVDRAELRTTLAYQFTGAFSAGLEYNPLADDLGVIANWRFVEETETTPAWMLGTSSDRIGTPSGRSVYLTAAKSLEAWLDLPVAPYAGVAYGEYDEEFVGIGGLAMLGARSGAACISTTGTTSTLWWNAPLTTRLWDWCWPNKMRTGRWA